MLEREEARRGDRLRGRVRHARRAAGGRCRDRERLRPGVHRRRPAADGRPTGGRARRSFTTSSPARFRRATSTPRTRSTCSSTSFPNSEDLFVGNIARSLARGRRRGHRLAVAPVAGLRLRGKQGRARELQGRQGVQDGDGAALRERVPVLDERRGRSHRVLRRWPTISWPCVWDRSNGHSSPQSGAETSARSRILPEKHASPVSHTIFLYIYPLSPPIVGLSPETPGNPVVLEIRSWPGGHE